MSLNNPLANVLSFIQNYERLGKKEVLTKNNSNLIKKVLIIMNKEGYINYLDLFLLQMETQPIQQLSFLLLIFL